MIAKGTAAIVKTHWKSRRNPMLSVNDRRPYVSIGVPLAALSLVGPRVLIWFVCRGITLTSAPVSTKNRVSDLQSVTKNRRLCGKPAAGVAETCWLSSFPKTRVYMNREGGNVLLPYQTVRGTNIPQC